MFRRLRDLREDSDLKQRELAAYLGCSQVCYSCYETGRHELPTSVLIKLASFYKTSSDYLLGMTDERAPYRRAKRHIDIELNIRKRCERLRELRKKNGLMQKDVAEHLNCSQVCYSFYEIGRRDTPPEVLVRLAEYYGTSADYLLGLTDEHRPYPRAK